MPIVPDGSLNLAALSVDDIYVIVISPQTPLIPGFPTDGIGIIGTASKGPLNTPIPFGDPQSLIRSFGDISTHKYDLVTEAIGAMKQGATNVWGVRVSDGADTAATASVLGRTGGSLVTFTAISTGTWANTMKVSIGPGSNNTAIQAGGTVTIGGSWTPGGDTANAVIGSTTASYTSVANDTTFTVAAALAAAINASTNIGLIASATVSGAVITIRALVPGTDGNSITLTASKTGSATSGTVVASGATFVNGSGTGTYKVQIQPKNDVAEIYDNISGVSGVGATSAAAAIVSAITNGVQGVRGPSSLVTAAVAAGTGTLQLQTVTFSSGLDGRVGVTANTLLGVDGLTRTGMYSLRGTNLAQFGLAGLTGTDAQTTWSTQLSFAQDRNMLCVTAFSASTDSLTAVNQKNTAAIDDPSMAFVKDFLWLNDTFNNQVRLVSPIGATLGRIAALSPERSPGNKPIYGYLGTERMGLVGPGGSFRAGIPYSRAELALLESQGILFMTQPAVGGNYLALRHGQNASSDPTRNGINYTKMTNFLAQSLFQAMGWVVDEVHTPELRRRVKSSIAQFLGSLSDPGPGRQPMIGDVNGGPAYNIIVDKTNNPDNLVALGYMFVSVQVKYLSIVRFFVIQLEAGQSVTVKVQDNPVLQAA